MSTKTEKITSGAVKMSSRENHSWISLVYPKRTVLGLVVFVLSKMENARISGNARKPGGVGKMREHPNGCFSCC